ncbi:hypothetical protein KI688_009900 [Linnemannia hyalina]|uniref:Uncharacterized protein n=1 Tax=Linnemannia hyalina TaxID=64524 RepID=A0A9P8BUR0_9FUNG|nr:hypothetical protein KI688_009900 [Linnemannia hyalina]
MATIPAKPTTTAKPLPKTTKPPVVPITTKPPVTPITTPKPPVIPITTIPPIITLTTTIPPVKTTTFGTGSVITVKPITTTSTSTSSILGGGGNNNSVRGQGSDTGGGDGDGMNAAAIGGLVAGLAIVLVGSVVGGFMLLKQRRKRMMFVGHGASASGSSSGFGGDGYPDQPDLPRPPRAGFAREGRPGSGTWSARSGYSGGSRPQSSVGRQPFMGNYSNVFDEKGYHADAAGLGGARMSVMGGGLGGGSGIGYSNNISGESFTQLHDGRFVANGRRGDGSPGGYNGAPGDVDNYTYDAQEYNAHLHNKEMSSSSAAFLPSPPSSPDGAFPPEGISPTESTSSGSAGLHDAPGQASAPLIGVVNPSPRASGFYENYNHVPLRSPTRTNMNAPPMSPNGNFVNRSSSRVSASIPYAPDGLPLFPPRPASQYQHANYPQQHPQQQQYYPTSPRSPPLPHMGGPPPGNYYSPRLGSQYNHHNGGGGPNFPPSPHPYQQQQQQQQRYLQHPHQQMYSGPMSTMTSSSVTAYDTDENGGVRSPQKYVGNEGGAFEEHHVYEEIYVQPQEATSTTMTTTATGHVNAGAPQVLAVDKPAHDAPIAASATPGAPAVSVEVVNVQDTTEPADLATLSPIVPQATSPSSPPPVPLSTKPSVGHFSISSST